MTPAWLPKHGSGFDLAIAIAVVDAQGDLPSRGPSRTVHLGELGLDGRLRPVPGVLPALLAARDHGVRSEEHRLNSSHVAISYAVFCLKNNRTMDVELKVKAPAV